mgnify:CR=1 FL=1
MDGISGSGLGYAGGRTGYMGQSDMDAFSGFGYAGGRTGYMGQYENDAFSGFGQANNPGVANPGPAANPATNQNNNPLKAINSKVFGRGTFNAPFFGEITPKKVFGGVVLGLLLVGIVRS